MIKRFYIEITNRCGLSCRFCHANTRNPRFMSIAEFRHILNQIRNVTEYIYLHVQGEPLLHPDVNTFLKIAYEEGFHVQLVTNAVLLKEHMDLLDAEALRKISFSIQSVEYHHMDTASYMETIFSFIEQASMQSHPYCELRFWRDDQMEMQRTSECIRMIHQRYHAADSGRIRNERILPGVYVDYSNPFSWPDTDHSFSSEEGTCLGGIEQLAVLCDGTLVPCCLDCEGKIPLGNLFTQPLSEIMNSERYTALVRGFRSHKISEELCRHCTFRLRFSK